MKTRKAKKVICYTGINHKKTGIHTPAEFTRITRKWHKPGTNCPKFMYPNGCPTNLAGWMKWAGAEMKDPVKCRKNAEAVNRNLRNYKIRKENDYKNYAQII